MDINDMVYQYEALFIKDLILNSIQRFIVCDKNSFWRKVFPVLPFHPISGGGIQVPCFIGFPLIAAFS